ncbi:MAG: hypothetical protein DSM106950_12360 [Stigonema ocellatum SAG 48.90 = DSM 106950]|nr:hypothetical protein [Stigonema ocellatum SAG 48.90 = DSM 106950]
MASKIISFRIPEELHFGLREQCLEGESVNDAARRIVLDALGGKPKVQASTDIDSLIQDAIASSFTKVNSRLQQLEQQLGESAA